VLPETVTLTDVTAEDDEDDEDDEEAWEYCCCCRESFDCTALEVVSAGPPFVLAAPVGEITAGNKLPPTLEGVGEEGEVSPPATVVETVAGWPARTVMPAEALAVVVVVAVPVAVAAGESMVEEPTAPAYWPEAVALETRLSSTAATTSPGVGTVVAAVMLMLPAIGMPPPIPAEPRGAPAAAVGDLPVAVAAALAAAVAALHSLPNDITSSTALIKEVTTAEEAKEEEAEEDW
jgi:hypothetical protein